MTSPYLSAKPSVLRCSRCGRFVDWEDARLQIIDTCKPHLELPAVLVRQAMAADREATIELIRRDFGHSRIVSYGENVDLDHADALVAEMRGELAGVLAYKVRPDALQMLALATDPMWQRSGVGGHLVAEAELLAKARKVRSVIVSTTNDNLPGLYFYQRLGYRLAGVSPEGMLRGDGSAPPGFAGIPVRDEIRLVKHLE
jgi:ribosomal protein S18 acetylase RimI-like enzyme